jgi:hypothetical protein
MKPRIKQSGRLASDATWSARGAERSAFGVRRARFGLLAIIALALAACAGSRAESAGGRSMEGLFEVKNISVSIRRAPADVYAFVASGENVPRWANGLGDKIERADDAWLAEGPIGKVKVRFAPPNQLGVADHDVTTEAGITVHNPIRVIPNGTGSTVIFTLLRRPGVSAQEFNDDAKAVERDLTTLKGILDQR